MKSKIRKNMVVKSELKPTTSVLSPTFVYIKPEHTDVRATFARIRAEMAHRDARNVTSIVDKVKVKK